MMCHECGASFEVRDGQTYAVTRINNRIPTGGTFVVTSEKYTCPACYDRLLHEAV